LIGAYFCRATGSGFSNQAILALFDEGGHPFIDGTRRDPKEGCHLCGWISGTQHLDALHSGSLLFRTARSENGLLVKIFIHAILWHIFYVL
jgi:hypothetical protein